MVQEQVADEARLAGMIHGLARRVGVRFEGLVWCEAGSCIDVYSDEDGPGMAKYGPRPLLAAQRLVEELEALARLREAWRKALERFEQGEVDAAAVWAARTEYKEKLTEVTRKIRSYAEFLDTLYREPHPDEVAPDDG